MTRLLTFTALAAGLAAPALAEPRSFECTMTEACRSFGAGCVAESIPYNFTLDAGTGEGQMEQREGNFFDGAVHESDGALHFLFVNSAGVELGTITETGDIIYTGNMALGDRLIHYRLSGTCTETTGTGGGSK